MPDYSLCESVIGSLQIILAYTLMVFELSEFRGGAVNSNFIVCGEIIVTTLGLYEI